MSHASQARWLRPPGHGPPSAPSIHVSSRAKPELGRSFRSALRSQAQDLNHGLQRCWWPQVPREREGDEVMSTHRNYKKILGDWQVLYDNLTPRLNDMPL